MAIDNLIITATTVNGDEVTLDTPIRIELSKNIRVPADFLTLTYPADTALGELMRINLSGSLTFSGIVDSISEGITERGKLKTVKCRSMAALLLDNHALPAEQTNPTPNDIMNIYCFYMGFQGFLYDSYVQIPSISATRGTSCWKMVEAYCEQAFGRTPHITQDNYISALGYGDSKIFTFGGEEGLPVFTIERVTDRTSPISGVSVRDENGNYSIALTNAYAPFGIRRHRYIIPEAPWLYYRELLGQRTMKRSMIWYQTVKIKTPALVNAELGDRAVISGDDGETVWRIGKLDLIADERGITTEVVLCDSAYLE